MEHAVDTRKHVEPKGGGAARRHQVATLTEPQNPVLQLQQQAGNLAVQEFLRAGVIRAKLAISNPHDPEEQEADQVADRVMRSRACDAVAAPCTCSSGEEMCEECRQKQTSASIHRNASGSAAPGRVPHIVHDVLRSSGHPLDPGARAYFEPRFGHDFSNVRVHTSPEAAASARSINAHAYTAGSDIVFADGKYSPDSPSGRLLLAHELTHVAEQARPRSSSVYRMPDKIAEEETPSIETIYADYQGPTKARQPSIASAFTSRTELNVTITCNDLEPGEYTINQISGPNYAGLPSGKCFLFKKPLDLVWPKQLKIVVGTSGERIAVLPPHIREFFTSSSSYAPKPSEEDMEDILRAAAILQAHGVTPDQLALIEKRRVDAEGIGGSVTPITNRTAWASRFVENLEKEKVAAIATRTSLAKAMIRLNALNRDVLEHGLHTMFPYPAGVGTSQFEKALQIDRDDLLAGTSFADAEEARGAYTEFSEAFDVELHALGTALLNQTEAALFRMEHRFSSYRNNFEDEINRLAADSEVQLARKRLHDVEDSDLRYDRANELLKAKSPFGFTAPIAVIELATDLREQELDALRKQLTTLIGRKSRLKIDILKHIDADDLFTKSLGKAFLNLLDGFYRLRSSLRNARKQFNSPRSIYGADILIATEKQLLGVEKGSAVEWIIDAIVSQKKSEKSFGESLLELLEVLSAFIPGPIGFAVRTGLAVVSGVRTIDQFSEQATLFDVGASSADASTKGLVKSLAITAGGVVFDASLSGIHGAPGEASTESLVPHAPEPKPLVTEERSVLTESTKPNPEHAESALGELPKGEAQAAAANATDAVTYVNEHPESIQGSSLGHREAPVGGGHKIVEVPDPNLPSGIACEFHSPGSARVPCPAGMGNPPSGRAVEVAPGVYRRPGQPSSAPSRPVSAHPTEPPGIIDQETREMLSGSRAEYEEVPHAGEELEQGFQKVEQRGGSQPGELGKLGKDLSRRAAKDVFGERWVTDEAKFSVTKANNEQVSFIADMGTIGSDGKARLVESKLGSGAGLEEAQAIGYPIIAKQGGIPANEAAERFARAAFPGWQPGQLTPPIRVRIDWWRGQTRNSVWLP
jgi:Domain of unknown function (DUF4157)